MSAVYVNEGPFVGQEIGGVPGGDAVYVPGWGYHWLQVLRVQGRQFLARCTEGCRRGAIVEGWFDVLADGSRLVFAQPTHNIASTFVEDFSSSTEDILVNPLLTGIIEELNSQIQD